ncbi:MAG TPA: DUF115 domain-containing protein [Candidatus Scalindua sp.]|nr:DUF115 domain-containing protein [Candidatus Scalindua sp.]
MPPSAFHALEFNLKVKAGMYEKERVKCFCGSRQRNVLTEVDRYGIGYKLCLCLDCGVLYSNPRLTTESFKRFYETDYRNIYGDIGEAGDEDKSAKELIYNTIDNYELKKPKIVFEIGCGSGNILKQFKGCDCTGVDYDSEVIGKAGTKGVELLVGGIEILEGLEKKADLIIMNHVLEHVNDLEGDLKRIRDLLADDGILFIGVPGLYTWNLVYMCQNAHNYQFNSNTLYYVMHVCGFSDYYLDEGIQSVWHKAEFQDRKHSYKDEYKHIESYLLRKDDKHLMPPIRMNSKFELKECRANMKYTVSAGVPEITELVGVHPDSEAVIVCGGPSINDYAEKIKALQKSGAKIYSIERMYQWCLKNSIIPDYIVALDASNDVIESFVKIHKYTTHLIVSHVKSDVVDLLKGHKAYYYHLKQKGIDLSKIHNNKEVQRITLIHTGASVSLTCLNIAMTLGATNLHVFGFDCHLSGGDYANGITGVGDIQGVINMEIEDRVFKTTSQFHAFMLQFFEMYQVGKDRGMLKSMKVYGDSMAKAASKIDIDGDKENDSKEKGNIVSKA